MPAPLWALLKVYLQNRTKNSNFRAWIPTYTRNKGLTEHRFNCKASNPWPNITKRVSLKCHHENDFGGNYSPPEEATILCVGELAKYRWVNKIFVKQHTKNLHEPYITDE